MDNNTWKEFLLADCISYTAAAVLTASIGILIPAYMFGSSHQYYLELFFVTTIINLLIVLDAHLPASLCRFEMLFGIIETAFGVIGIGGGFFHWFAWQPLYLIEASVILLMVYFVTYIIMYWQNREIARKINECLKKAKPLR
jgi:low affinity Fe/Cu permease